MAVGHHDSQRSRLDVGGIFRKDDGGGEGPSQTGGSLSSLPSADKDLGSCCIAAIKLAHPANNADACRHAVGDADAYRHDVGVADACRHAFGHADACRHAVYD